MLRRLRNPPSAGIGPKLTSTRSFCLLLQCCALPACCSLVSCIHRGTIIGSC